ncbi:MAG TPA: hypothetical protein VIM70_10630 [Clostridium sp.]|uniref:hypothetical protein n=1 Tax=Clostridium sp. TaxID=1506 RepID=UPI002F95FB9C
MKLFKKDKRFPLTTKGIEDMFKYEKDIKIKKINGYTGIAVILVLFGLGFLSKEIFMIMIATKGLNGITDIIFR